MCIWYKSYVYALPIKSKSESDPHIYEATKAVAKSSEKIWAKKSQKKSQNLSWGFLCNCFNSCFITVRITFTSNLLWYKQPFCESIKDPARQLKLSLLTCTIRASVSFLRGSAKRTKSGCLMTPWTVKFNVEGDTAFGVLGDRGTSTGLWKDNLVKQLQ